MNSFSELIFRRDIEH